jgi:hypothetical protein
MLRFRTPRPEPGPLAIAGQARQGDVMLDPVPLVPDTAKAVSRTGGRIVLAEGEATGHAHAIAAAGATLLVDGDDRYLQVTSAVPLGHEEHGTITVLPGTYRVVIQREYVPPEVEPAGTRRVID